jgi:hypothetical protein
MLLLGTISYYMLNNHIFFSPCSFDVGSPNNDSTRYVVQILVGSYLVILVFLYKLNDKM